ncbi:sulfotransferase domain-containing protein [Arcobacter sp.]|uniref:sulfotransferase domain-containing protein n=1 Tax=unclassified Arcobacter TaxID=2593671 RepID=UPI003AFFFCCB
MKLEKIAYIIGMPRAGTTFLYHNLNKHPDLYVPFRRKTNYFSLHKDKNLEWFLEHFKEMNENQIGIDTETLYFVDKKLKSYKKIKDTNPNAKVMLFVRQPDEWVYSFYKQIATFDKNICSFEDFLQGKYTLIEDGKEIPFNIKDGDIKNIIEDIKNIYGEQLLILDFKLFKENPLKLLNEIEFFLSIDDFFNEFNFQNKKINASDRGHIPILANLLRQEWLINLLSKLPASIVKRIRVMYDNLSSLFSKKTKKSSNISKIDENILLAQKYFEKDIEYYNNLFKDIKC